MPTAKIFRNGRSQAVRLPKEFRFKGEEVILEPLKQRAWPPRYWKSWRKVPNDFRAPDPLPSGTSRVSFDEA
jgi:virulence-associated protein VagC